jgi:anti-anti-sigma regulatory factor
MRRNPDWLSAAGAVGLVIPALARTTVRVEVPAPLLETLGGRDRGWQVSLIVDLGGVRFIESSGLHVLCEARDRVRHGGGVLVTVCPDPQVRRIPELTGLVDVLNVTASRQEALALAARSTLLTRSDGTRASRRDPLSPPEMRSSAEKR